ncbi:MAG: hypothetical protein U0842_12460 [Candidatus Binatia bacterium]
MVLIEDAHGLDEASPQNRGARLDAVAGTRVLLLLNSSEFSGPVFRHAEIAPPPLGPRAANELLPRLLGDSETLADLRAWRPGSAATATRSSWRSW